ncbi:helix-turn-helix transcriptional regulator [Bradyrhizobium elkanii]
MLTLEDLKQLPPAERLAALAAYFSYPLKNRMLDSWEAAALLGLSETTMRINRIKGTGPKFIKLPGGRLVRYAEMDLLLYLYESRRQSTSENAA